MSDSQRKPRYILRPVVTPVADAQASESADQKPEATADPFLRPAQEDDDGYDPFSDRPPTPSRPSRKTLGDKRTSSFI